MVRSKNQDKLVEKMEDKLSQIQEQLKALMNRMVSINDRNAQTNKELIEMKNAISELQQKHKATDEGRAKSSIVKVRI